MTTKMTRRTFLKGAAAAAAAVSLSGLLTGCGGDQLADNEVQIGAYTVKVYGLDVDQGTEMNKAGAILGKVKLKFADGGGNCQWMQSDPGGSHRKVYRDRFHGRKAAQHCGTGAAAQLPQRGLALPVPERCNGSADHQDQRHDRHAVSGKAGQRICCHQDQTHELIKDLLPRALWKECPGLFVVLPRGRRMVLGSFSGNVKKCATVFTVSLQAPCKSQARPPKFYLHFARVWSQPPAGMRYNKAVPKEAQ